MNFRGVAMLGGFGCSRVSAGVTGMPIPDERGNPSRSSPWIAFHHTTFMVVWVTTVVTNVGTSMYNAASGWLMTSLDADPLTVSLVQVATSLPMFLFALPAGALADIVDKRRFLIISEIVITAMAAISAVLVGLDLINPSVLLLFTFLLGAGAAFTAPAWQSVVSKLLPKQDLAAAVASNGVGVNISRAIGPALDGVVIGALGIAAPFWISAEGRTSGRASDRRDGDRLSSCTIQSEFTCNSDKSGGILLFRERVLGPASACRAQPDRGRPGSLRHTVGRDRSGCRRGRFRVTDEGCARA